MVEIGVRCAEGSVVTMDLATRPRPGHDDRGLMSGATSGTRPHERSSRARRVVAVLALVLVVAACASPSDTTLSPAEPASSSMPAPATTTPTVSEPTVSDTAAEPQPGILYAADADGATIETTGTATRLQLAADTAVTWFTDRPARKAGTIDLRTLVALWDASGFTTVPPNAALIVGDDARELTHVVEMSDPVLADDQVTFTLTAIPDGAAAGHGHADELAEGRYERALLFIDDASLSPCPATLPVVAGVKAKMDPLNSTSRTVLQCLLAPGATITVHSQSPQLATTTWGCAVNPPSTYVDAGIALGKLTACGAVSGFGEAWLGGGPCHMGVSPQITYARSAPVPMRLTVTTESPECVDLNR
jgi:hypothetical protein